MSRATRAERDLARALVERVLTSAALPPLYDKQRQLVMTEAHHAAFIAGIGSGKSFAGAVRAWRAAMGWIGSRRLRTPNLGIITAPTFDMLRDASLRSFREVAERDLAPGQAGFNENKMLIRMRNGSEILLRSAHKPERLRGPSAAWWWGDEAALYPAIVRKIMVGRLRQFGQLGYDWVTTTPRGRNWVWQAFVRDVAEGRRDEYLLIQAHTGENIFLDRAVLKEWEGEYVGDFARQELGGEFVSFEGLIYSEFDRQRHVMSALPDGFAVTYAGVDWGFANPGVIVVGGVDSDGRLSIVRVDYARQRRIEEWVAVAQQLRAVWNIQRFFCDPASPDNIRAFVDAGLPAEAGNNAVLTGIQLVKNRLAWQADGQPRLLVHADAVHLIDEFEQYQWAENRLGVRDQPVKAHDHALDALRYLVVGTDQPRMRRMEAQSTRYGG